MSYSRSSIQKKVDYSRPTNESAQTQRVLPSVPVLQKVEPEEEPPLQGKFAIQRQEPEEELPLQGKFVAQRQSPEEELPLQGKFRTIQRMGNVPINDDPGLEHEADVMGAKALQTKPSGETVQRAECEVKPNNTGMPDNLKTGIETLSGFSMDNVNVHYNSPKPAQLQALAYAQGTDIHVAPGQEKHVPHEAWHVVQQMQGRVEPTT